jgi:tetratricopeptide (TPR) repeat protein
MSTDASEPLNWTRLDEEWNFRHQPERLAAYERELDTALYKRGEKDGYPLQWRWSRLSYFRALQEIEARDTGQRTAAEANAAALRHLQAGAQEGGNAAMAQPNRVEGHFWAGVNALEAARLQGPLAAARALKPAQASIDRAAGIDEEFYFGGPLRVQGRIMHFKPLILGGLVDRALEIYGRALQVAPHNSTTLLYTAQALVADRQPARARTLLNQILSDPDDPQWMWEQARDRRIARAELLKL